MIKSRIGFITTWNQQCGLATYAKYLLNQFDKDTFIVLAEESQGDRISSDEPFVTRCWKKGDSNFDKIQQVIELNNLKILYLNCQYRFFKQPEFSIFLKKIQSQGVKVIAHIHNPFTLHPDQQELIKSVNHVIVHSEENKLEVIANGASSNQISVVPHGVEKYFEPNRDLIRENLGITSSEKMIVAFGFVQPHKGMEGLIKGVAYLRTKGIPVKGFIVGGVNHSDPQSQQYLQQLIKYAEELGISEYIKFSTGFVSDRIVQEHLAASDLVLMNYHSQHYEASGACSLAIGAGALVATSIAPPFLSFGNAVWHITSGFPVELSMEILLTNEIIRKTILENAGEYNNRNSWKEIKNKLNTIFREMGIELSKSENIKIQTKKNKNMHSYRVLMQNRPTAISHPGGDTVVMDRIKKELELQGVTVTIDLDSKEDPAKYDLVHLFNFATPEYTKYLAERAFYAGTPYVVTTLYEDIPSFHNQSREIASCLIGYVSNAQNKEWWKKNKPDISKITKISKFDNTWTAAHAAGLFVTGEEEAKALRRDYKDIGEIFEIKLGCEISKRVAADKFIKEFSFKDFVLCVGRIESRKNQLMLLKALEDDSIPVVIAGSGFSYQPDYDQAVRAFKRRGPTLILGRLDNEMLASAYSAAKVHALPSWYELPGLVSLEGAYYGCNVVAGEAGTCKNYLGTSGFYCSADNEESIRGAVFSAFEAPRSRKLQDIVNEYTWQNVGKKTLEAYQSILGVKMKTENNIINLNVNGDAMSPTYDMDSELTDFQDLIEKGELATKSRKIDQAFELLRKAEKMNQNSARLMKALGALHLSNSESVEASKYFDKALSLAPNDAKCLIGRGMCETITRSYVSAFDYFVNALKSAPLEIVAIYQLLECGLNLGKYIEVISALETYLISMPDDLEMRYCLAACYYKNFQIQAAEIQTQLVLKKSPDHKAANELLIEMKKNNKMEVPSAIEAKIDTNETKIETKIVTVDSVTNSNVNISFTHNTLANRKLIQRDHQIDIQLAELNQEKRNGNLEKVKHGCDRIMFKGEATPDQIDYAKVLKAEVAILDGDLNEATRIYQETLITNPLCARALCGIAALSANRGDWLAAEAKFQEARNADPKCDIAAAGLGMCYGNSGNPMKAWDYYQEALQLNPENLRALLGVIELGYPFKRLKEVENGVKGYLDLHPADCNFIYSLAGCYFAQGRYPESLEELEKVLMFEPDNQHALELKDLIYSKVGVASTAEFKNQ